MGRVDPRSSELPTRVCMAETSRLLAIAGPAHSVLLPACDPVNPAATARTHRSPAPLRRVPAARAHRSPDATGQRPQLRPTPSLLSMGVVCFPFLGRRCSARAGSAPSAFSPTALATRAIAAGPWIASTRRGPAHLGKASMSRPNPRRSRSAHGNRRRPLRRRPPCGTNRRTRTWRSDCWRRSEAVAGIAGVAALFAPAAPLTPPPPAPWR